MREYKFRVWDKDNTRNKMMYSKTELFDDIIGFRFEHFDGDLKDLKIMQWTGLKDTDDKDIYEGDIVQFNPPHHLKYPRKNKSENYVVGYITDEANFRGVKENKGSMGILNSINAQQGLKVIGNIFENPELIKEENNERD